MVERFTKSDEIKNKALSLIPHQTGTFSRGADCFVKGVFPTYIQTAKGSHFTDVDGNEYLDYLCGLGPITLGYNYKSGEWYERSYKVFNKKYKSKRISDKKEMGLIRRKIKSLFE
mgnify:CR=1 FL=1